MKILIILIMIVGMLYSASEKENDFLIKKYNDLERKVEVLEKKNLLEDRMNKLETDNAQQITIYKDIIASNQTIHTNILYVIVMILTAVGGLLTIINIKWLDAKIRNVIDSKANDKINKLDETVDKASETLKNINKIKSALDIKSSEYENITKDLEEVKEYLKNKSHEEFTTEDKRKLDLIALELNSKKNKNDTDWFLIGLEYLEREQFNESILAFKNAYNINNKNLNVIQIWAVSLIKLSRKTEKEKEKEKIILESIEKSVEANKLFKDNFVTYSNWGLAISELAKLQKDNNKKKELYKEGIDKYERAYKLKSNEHNNINNWGTAISELASITEDENERKKLLKECFEKYEEAFIINGKFYNMACIYALNKDKGKALEYLENSLKNDEVKVEFVKKDPDWNDYKNDSDLVKILNKYEK